MSIVQRPKVQYNSGIDVSVDNVMTASGRFKEDGLVKSFEIVFSKNGSTTFIPFDEYEVYVNLEANKGPERPITIFVLIDFSKKLDEDVAAILNRISTTSMEFVGELTDSDIRTLELGNSVSIDLYNSHQGFFRVYMNLESSKNKEF